MKYNCIIVDDEPIARRLLKMHLNQIPDFELVAECSNAIQLSQILKKEQVDLIFLDIEMPILKGTDFLKNHTGSPKVIFTTAYREYALQAFDLGAIDYLLKPISFPRFYKSIQKFLVLSDKTYLPKNFTEKYIFITKNRKKIRLLLSQLVYVESKRDYIYICMESESYTIKKTLNSFYKELNESFIQVHRSFIVNKDKVLSYSKTELKLSNGIIIPIGDKYKDGVIAHFV